jgi:hypothetical protein
VPTPCSLVAGFRDVILINQRYTADIDAYDVPIEDLTPFGGFASGARQMRDATTGEVVAPRWTTHCGGGAATAAIAQVQRRVFVRPCDPLVDHDPSATQLAVPPSAVLGADACSVADSYDISFDQGGLPAATSIPCGAADGALYDVEDGVTYVIYATAMVDGALSGSLCLATGRQGETVTPTCQPLTPNGNAKLELATLMNGAEPVCPDGALYDVLADGSDALNPVPIPCNQAANLGPFPPGLMLFSALIYDSMGAAVSSASCSAIIEPGRIVDAVCVP